MSWLKGVPAVTYAVNQDTLKQWAWFWIEGLGGELVSKDDDVLRGDPAAGLQQWRISLGAFDTVLIAGFEKKSESEARRFTQTFGDHSVFSVDFGVENVADFRKYLHEQAKIPMLGSPLGTDQGFNFLDKTTRDTSRNPTAKSALKRIDHITYAVTQDTIEECAKFWVDGMGGTVVLRSDDVRPNDSQDSMMLWGIVLNKGIPEDEIGIALVAGIDKQRVSQVNRFVTQKGPNIVQHVAYDVGDMNAFQRRFKDDFGANLLSESLVVPDGFGGFVKQVFGRGYESGNAAEVGFPEFLERLDGSGKGFTNAAGDGLYERVQKISEQMDETPIVDFSRMPANWEPRISEVSPNKAASN